jgi:CubicO group peptidase (beta-lactamase class C family)
MTLDSVFRIASMTKAVTGTAAMQLVEEGRIGLDQPMGDVLPVIKNVKVLEGFDAGGAPRLRDPRGPVTLRHLLTHTSAAALAVPGTLAAVNTSAAPERRGAAIGAWTGFLMLGFSIGPLLGGVLTHVTGRRVISGSTSCSC